MDQEVMPVASPPDPAADVQARLSAVFGSSGARLLSAVREYGRNQELSARDVLERVRAAVACADRLRAAGWWGGLPPARFARMFRSRRWLRRARRFKGRTAHASRERLFVAAAVHLAVRVDPSSPAFRERLEEDIRARIDAAVALIDRNTNLARFEHVYGPRADALGRRWEEPGLIGAIALARARATGSEAVQQRAADLCAGALIHLEDIAEKARACDARCRCMGLPIPEGPPELPLRFWVQAVVSRHLTHVLARRSATDVADIAATIVRRVVRDALVRPIGDALMVLPTREFEVFAIDRVLAPRTLSADADEKRHGDGRDRVIAQILGISTMAVHNNRRRRKQRLERGDQPFPGDQR